MLRCGHAARRRRGPARPQRPLLTLSSQEPLDAGIYPPGYDAFTFHGLPTPQHGGSPDNAIPTPHALPTGSSVDSGLGGEFDESTAARARSSSEEKDNLTPAQSRRKAQNRAAYAPSLCCKDAIADLDVANAPSASARNAMYAISKPSSTPLKTTHIRSNQTTSA